MAGLIVNILWVSLICTVLIFCLRLFSAPLNRRYTAKWKYWVWLVITLRLIVPINFILPQVPVSAAVSEAFVVNDISVAQIFLPQAEPPGAYDPELMQASGALQHPVEGITLYEALFIIWLIGALAFAALQMARYFRAKRKILRWSTEIKRAEIHEVIERLSKEMGIEKSVIPMVNGEISSPMVMGIKSPVLVLPHERYTSHDLSFILRHELTHYKNKDIIYKIGLFIASAIHWFNPAVYLMVREAHADLERVCDDEVTRNCPVEERRAYSEVILSSISRNNMRGNVLTTYFYTGTRNIKARFLNIMNTERGKSGYAGIFAIAFTAVIISGFAIPVSGYAIEDAASFTLSPSSELTFSHTFTQLVADMAEFDNLEINLMYGDLLLLVNDWLVTGTQVHFSGPTLFNTLTINPATRTAYIKNTDEPLFGPGESLEEFVLIIVVSGESDWAFEQANIHLEHGSIRYIGASIEEYFARSLNLSLPRGSRERVLLGEVFTGFYQD